MAKRSKKAAAGKASGARKQRKQTTQAATPADVMKVPSEAKLKALYRSATSADADKNEAVGRKGSLISNAVEKDHLDKVAWGIVCRLARMSTNKAATARAHLDHYIAALGLDEKWAQQEQMFEREETDPGVEAPESDDVIGETEVSTGGSFAEKVREAAAIPTTARH